MFGEENACPNLGYQKRLNIHKIFYPFSFEKLKISKALSYLPLLSEVGVRF